MTRFLHIVTIGVCCTGLSVSSTLRQEPASQTPLSRAVATVELVAGQPTAIVHLTNLSAVPIEAWRIVLTADMGGGARPVRDVMTDVSMTLLSPGSSGYVGPIAPGEARDLSFVLSAVPLYVSVDVPMLLFQDLSSEGSKQDVAFLLQQRERCAKSLKIWSEALEAAATMPPQQAKRYLRHLLVVERQSADASDSWATGLRMTISDLVNSDQSSQAFTDQVNHFKRLFLQTRERALRKVAR